ncbi:MAG: response regulator [Elusimicrobiota bacterium]
MKRTEDAPGGAASILVVDDEPGIRDFLAFELGSMGYRVVTAGGGQEALERLKADRFQLVISDVKMPKIGGIEVLEAAKRTDPGIEVIMATGYGSVETAVAAMKKGAYEFIEKPFSVGKLRSIVEQALQKKELKAMLAVYESSRAVFTSMRPESLYPLIIKLAARLLKADEVALLLRRGKTFELAASYGIERRRVMLALAERVAKEAAGRKEPFLLRGAAGGGGAAGGVPGALDIGEAAIQPLMKGDELMGLLIVSRARLGGPFLPPDLRHLCIFGAQIAQAVANAAAYADLEARIVELKEANRRIDEAQAQLVESDKLVAVGRLAAGVAHELNNPLTGILGLASVLLEEGGLAPDLRGDIESIRDNGERCRRIIQELMQFSRKSRPQREVRSVGDLLEFALTFTKIELRHSGMRLKREWPERTPSVLADPGKIQQVFVNLIINAAHAVAERPLRELAIRVEEGGGKVLIHFKDTGGGIAREHLERIFEPFFTTKPAGKGTGLGLSISHELIAQHGGALRVTSAAGAGTTFTVELPLHEEA